MGPDETRRPPLKTLAVACVLLLTAPLPAGAGAPESGDPVAAFDAKAASIRDTVGRMSEAEKAVAVYDAKAAKLREDLARSPADPTDREWVKAKLSNMYELDVYSMKYFHSRHFEGSDGAAFSQAMSQRIDKVFEDNIRDLKKLLEVYSWFPISQFGEEAAAGAAVVAQHANSDVPFQEDALHRMEKLYAAGEVKRSKYAFLYDRVMVHRKRPQRFGTQGYCAAPGEWRPCPMEAPSDPASVAARRTEAGIEPASLDDYKKLFATVCRQGSKEEDVCR